MRADGILFIWANFALVVNEFLFIWTKIWLVWFSVWLVMVAFVYLNEILFWLSGSFFYLGKFLLIWFGVCLFMQILHLFVTRVLFILANFDWFENNQLHMQENKYCKKKDAFYFKKRPIIIIVACGYYIRLWLLQFLPALTFFQTGIFDILSQHLKSLCLPIHYNVPLRIDHSKI